MCGIFGIVAQRASILPMSELHRLLDSLFALSESRGKEAAGLAIGTDDQILVLKRNLRGKVFSRLPQVKKMLATTDNCALTLMGHTRMVTNGDARDVANNQPVVRDNLACIHNGIITNEGAIWQAEPDLARLHAVDTEVFLALTESSLRQGQSLICAVQQAIKRLIGANSFAVMHGKGNGVVLATTNGSLYWAADEQARLALFASERFILEQILDRAPLRGLIPLSTIQHVHPGAGLVLAVSGLMVRQFELDEGGLDHDLPIMDRPIVDYGSASDLPIKHLSVPNVARLFELEQATRIDFELIRRLRRCTVCLLPETFPFIQFDEAGVCSVCRRNKPVPIPGKEVLLRQIGTNSKSSLACLAPISGGRDSCYGLHYMVKELGLHPVAYTYDWGMVTDLARRNISRMCGALGIEHILVSADIARKREFIRMNVSAWLKRPHLGTVPLFMAGDKQFFYFAEKLRSQMRLQTILFSMNPLERTDFKVGFCGIDEGYEKNKHYEPTLLNKLRLASFYGEQYLLNPAYLNASLLDTLGAYASYYLLPKRYEQLFDYIPWHEAEIEQTLINGYDWELATDTRSTWRIGDGTAPFYNYIYLRVAGFSENDTFRSNQIREGLIDRETALARIEAENQPRIESLAWYFDVIGLDAMQAIQRVNAMPKLY